MGAKTHSWLDGLDRRRVDWGSGHNRRAYELFSLGRREMTALDLLMRFWIVPYLLAFAIGGMYWALRPAVPVVARSVEVLTPTVKAGEMARFLFTMHRDRTCPATISGFWIDESGKAVERLPIVAGGYGRVGDVKTPVDIRTPQVTGRMAYRSHMFSICESGSYVMTSPDAWVTVVP
jgi:hypothetical protein